MKKIILWVLSLALVVISTSANAAGANRHVWAVVVQDEDYMEYPSGVQITVCDESNCQTEYTNGIGKAFFHLPVETTSVTVYFDAVYPENVEYCPVTINWSLSGVKENGPTYHYVWIYECGIPPRTYN